MMALAAGAQVGDLAIILPKLQAYAGNDETWHEQWSLLGDIAIDRAKSLTTNVARSETLFLATLYKIMAEHFIPPNDPRRLQAYREVMELFRQACEFKSLAPRRVSIPYELTSLPAYFLPADSDDLSLPTVIFVCGLDTTKELWYLRARDQFIARGMNCLFVDTPGIGEALRLQNLPTISEYEKPISAAVRLPHQPEDGGCRTYRIGRQQLGWIST